MPIVQNWREVLSRVISGSQARERLSFELGVSPSTLHRWASGESSPRFQHLSALLKALPEQRGLLRDSLQVEFPHLKFSEETEELRGISSTFYAEVLDALACTLPPMRFWSVSNLILRQALLDLDPYKLGLSISVAQCVPPHRGQKISSLRSVIGINSYQGAQLQENRFWGSGSLVGYATMTGRNIVQDSQSKLPLYEEILLPYKGSAMVCPILREGHIAGSLLVLSTTRSIVSSEQLELTQAYARLLSLAFKDINFYSPDMITLKWMPSYEIQLKYLATCEKRIKDILLTAQKENRFISPAQAEERAWKGIEKELLNEHQTHRDVALPLSSSSAQQESAQPIQAVTSSEQEVLSDSSICVLSYAPEDYAFIEKLHADLQIRGISCWLAPHDLNAWGKRPAQVDWALPGNAKLLLVLSEHSVDSTWIQKEVETALERERQENALIIYPLRVDEAIIRTNQQWAFDIRRTHLISDFRDWNNLATYLQALHQLPLSVLSGDVDSRSVDPNEDTASSDGAICTTVTFTSSRATDPAEDTARATSSGHSTGRAQGSRAVDPFEDTN